MPLRESPKFRPSPDRMLEIPQPAIAGLNLKDLEYEQEVNQSPYMLNMMYRNGAFSKRYGQENVKSFSEDIYAMAVYRGSLIVHSGTKVYKGDTEIASGMDQSRGLFVLFNQNLYYFIASGIYQYDGTTWSTITPYVPTIVINRHPDGTSGDTSESYNMVGTGFQNNFHGDGTSTEYHLTDFPLDETVPKVTVDNVQWTYDASLSGTNTFKVDYTTGVVTLSAAAPEGTNNVEIVAYKHDDEWTSYHTQILASKYYACFGGNNNSRLFVAGGGKSTYYYSDVFDPSYFPYTNYAKVGNSAEDITGFGQQYNVLIVFKPTEIHSLTYYVQSSSTTTSESEFGKGAFTSQVVNSTIGCDCPNTIQLINNQLTWLSSKDGVCTLVSTNIIDERNVRSISRNIDRTNNMGIVGLLDWQYIGETISADYDSKYFLCNPRTGMCFMWDYLISPYYISSTKAASAKDLDWFLFSGISAKEFIKYDGVLHYSKADKKIAKLNDSFSDFGNAIESYYMTPFMQFNAVEYLKNVKNIYVQCRGDTASVIDMYYRTEQDISPEHEADAIRIGGRMWEHFQWNNFQWLMVNWANTFMRKCSLKKVQMASFYFENRENNRDMSISHIGISYSIVKAIK